MLKEKIEKALNKQLNEELFSSYLYLQMAAYCENENLSGFSSWLRLQSQEEYGHAMKLYDYILQRDAKVVLQNIDHPKHSWKSVLDVFTDTFNHEKEISRSIDEIMDACISEKDYATTNFLQWFISEQVEEEATASKILDRVKLVGDNKNGLYLLDREMAGRARA